VSYRHLKGCYSVVSSRERFLRPRVPEGEGSTLLHIVRYFIRVDTI